MDWGDPARIDLAHPIRTVSFENPDGTPGTAGTAHGGRKGAPNRRIAAGERVVLADLAGPGRIRHFWCTIPPMPPERMRAVVLEVFYGGASEPSVSVPLLDFFGCPHGRPVPFHSVLFAAQEGRGFNAWLPMPFHERIRVELTNHGTGGFPLYYQIDFTEGPQPADVGLLHASFRRENPTTLAQDFTIARDLRGPGRFLGCSVGIRVLHEPDFSWYGEGEVKIYLDDDDAHPTWCGTGLEDYVGTAWGMGAHATPLQGAPLVLQADGAAMPDFVSFYRWHLPDPIVFERSMRATLQQIGAVAVPNGQREIRARLEAAGRAAGGGFVDLPERSPLEAFGICERQDDVCATAFVACRDPQPVPPVDPADACADLARRPWETPSPFEPMLAALTGS